MANFERIVSAISSVFDKVAWVAVVAMAALVFTNVAGRFFFKTPVLGVYDFAGLMGAILFSFGLANCALRRGHVSITLFVERMSPRVQGIVNIVIGLISTVFFVIATWRLEVYGTVLKDTNVQTMTTLTPVYPFVYLVGLAYLMLAVALLLDLIRAVVKVVRQ